MMKQSGASCSVYNAPDDVRVCFYPTLGQMMRGFEKNGFTVTGRYSIVRHILVQLVGSWVELGPWLAILMPWPSVQALGIATALVVASTNVLVARWCQRGLLGALIPGLGAVIFVAFTSRAALLALARGGVSWRGTFYRLEDLRCETRIVLPF